MSSAERLHDEVEDKTMDYQQQHVAATMNAMTLPAEFSDMMAPEPIDPSEEPDLEIDAEGDSGYGDSVHSDGFVNSSGSSTISSNLPSYTYRHGRRYQGFAPGAYNFPNDEAEQARLDMLHYAFTRLMENRLHLADIHPEAKVLDIGTGTGSWAIHFGDIYPASAVVGVDLSPIQPAWVPPNVRFAVDDVELDWPEEDTYDYIHIRYMAASIKDWPRLMEQVYRHLNPGGWIECQDSINTLYSCPTTDIPTPDTTSVTPLPPSNALANMMQHLGHACDVIGRDFNPASNFTSWMTSAGFLHVEQDQFVLPVGSWPSDPRLKEIGALMALNFTEGSDAFTAALFTDVLGWTKEEVNKLVGEVDAAARETRESRPLFKYLIVKGQKPLIS